MDKHRADVREASGISWFDELLQDLRYGGRGLIRNPGYAALAIVTLGLGIGANTAIFSVINGVLLKPLPYEHGDRLMVVRQSAPLSGQATTGVAIAEYFDYRDQAAGVFDGLVEYHQMSFDLLQRGEPDRVATGVVSHNFFDVLGIQPILGRSFVADAITMASVADASRHPQAESHPPPPSLKSDVTAARDGRCQDRMRSGAIARRRITAAQAFTTERAEAPIARAQRPKPFNSSVTVSAASMPHATVVMTPQ